MIRVCLILILCVLAVALQGCAQAFFCGHPRITRIQPFTQTVPGSTVTFVMQPIPNAFWIGQTEVTWDTYDVFLFRLDIPPDQRASAAADPGADAVSRPTPPYAPPDRGWGHGGYPAIGVTFNAAQQYCRWLSQKTGRRYRLPTVSEWQLACRGIRATGAFELARFGRSTPSEVETQPSRTDRAAWCAENSQDKSHPVASKPPNEEGLYDMLGNVAEWCTDADGKPIVCGGSFQTPRDELSCELIERQTPAWNASDGSFPKSKWWLSDGPFVGFRVICEIVD